MTEFSYQKIIDISLPLNPRTMVYPGNPQIVFEPLKSGGGSQLTKITIGSHSGTHVDAPLHAISTGSSIDVYSLNSFVGPCRVIDVTESQESVQKSDLEKKSIVPKERILLKTQNSLRGYKTFLNDFTYISGEASKYLASKQTLLVGFDYLSVKKRGSPDNKSHTALLGKNIPIVEGLDLLKVEEGEYFLVVLPLKLTDLDGSPARAVLLR